MTQDIWTIKRVLDWTCGYLERKGDEHPRLSAEWLLAAVTGLSRVELYVNFDKPLEAAELDEMHAAIERRIDAALSDEKDVRVLEVGTGTGCIALSLASERPGTHVVATDLSERAIELATRNREALGLEGAVDIVECDLASGVDSELMGTFSVLVSNPPYIPTRVLSEEVPTEVRDFEPGLALDGGPDGLDVFRRLLDLAPTALAPGGMLAVELYEGSLDDAAALVRERDGWSSVEVREDLTHRPRVLVARREA